MTFSGGSTLRPPLGAPSLEWWVRSCSVPSRTVKLLWGLRCGHDHFRFHFEIAGCGLGVPRQTPKHFVAGWSVLPSQQEGGGPRVSCCSSCFVELKCGRRSAADCRGGQALGAAIAAPPPSEMDVALAADGKDGRDDQVEKKRRKEARCTKQVLSILLCGTRDDSICQPVQKLVNMCRRAAGQLEPRCAANVHERNKAAWRHVWRARLVTCWRMHAESGTLFSLFGEVDRSGPTPARRRGHGALRRSRRSSRGRC